MNVKTILLTLVTLTGCLPSTVYDREELSDGDTVGWSGWVYADIPADNVPVLEVGAVTVTDESGEIVAEGEQPSTGSPGYWQIDVPPQTDVTIRIEGDGVQPTVWRTMTPSARAYWFAGALFTVSPVTMDTFWSQLSELFGAPETTEDGVSLYGQPILRNEADEAAWTDAHLEVWDEDGGVHEVFALSLDEATGGLALAGPGTGPISTFAAPSLPPGPVRLIVDGSDGRSMVAYWTGQPGDLLSAFYMALPEDSP